MSDGNDPSSSDGDGSSGHDSSDDEDSSEIMRACERDDLERLRRALDDGAPVDGYADSPGSPLYRVCEVANLSFISTREDKLAMVMLLLERGADINKDRGRNPLARACYRRDLELARILLDHGAEVNIERCNDGHDRSAMSFAVGDGYFGQCPALVKLLIDRGAVVNRGHLFHAVGVHQGRVVDAEYRAEKFAILRLLLDNNANVFYERWDGAMTALDVAARWYPWIAAFFRKYLTILVRKHVIGPPAEHPSRRIEHQAPLIASFLV